MARRDDFATPELSALQKVTWLLRKSPETGFMGSQESRPEF